MKQALVIVFAFFALGILGCGGCSRSEKEIDPLPMYVEQLSSDEEFQREIAAEFLKSADNLPEPMFQVLMDALANETEPRIRLILAEALKNLEPDACGHIGELQQALVKEKDLKVRNAMLEAEKVMGEHLLKQQGK